MKEKDNKSHKYINRELSWLEFNNRVLEEAQDGSNPLFERLKFEAIVSSNLDEFFMVRVGSLWDRIAAGVTKKDPSGLTPEEQLFSIILRVQKMIYDKYNCFNRSLIPALKKEKIHIIKPERIDEEEKKYIENYFMQTVYPVLTPMVVDKSRPFPLILNKSLNIGLTLEGDKEGDELFATVQVPSVLGRFVEIPSSSEERHFILMEDIIKLNIGSIFIGHKILSLGCYRITRNADLDFDEEEAEDLLEEIKQSIKRRKWGAVVRLEVEQGMSKKLFNMLYEEYQVPDNAVYEIPGAIDLTFLMKLGSLEGYDHLRYERFVPDIPAQFMEEDIFKAINKEDILIHCPFESFDPVIELVKKAAVDPEVLAIKQTLYRVSGNSPIVEALAQAAENGKQVTVLLELKARFDEENNIQWAERLERAGCHVIYGLVGLKTHCKILLIVRKEESIKRYVHLSTGNYNDVTAKIYTDIGLFTSNPYIGADASALFNMLSGYSMLNNLYKLSVAPVNLRERFIQLIRHEAENARNGGHGRIIAKVNSLVDEEIINELYKASNAGVEIDLIIRGICCLRPGVHGISERIKVRSIVGRFLEHSRIYCFHNNGDEAIYLSSADWMGRNLDRRVELLFPVEDINNKRRVKNILNVYLSDTTKARILNSDGKYSRVDRRGKTMINSQEYFFKVSSYAAMSKKEN